MERDVAMGDLGYTRRVRDFYPTPEWVTETVIPYLRQHHLTREIPVWEPACGTGEMSEVLRRHFDTVTSSDIADYGYRPSTPGIDFLVSATRFKARAGIITNPPYGDQAESFIHQALRATEEGEGVVAMLLRNEYDSAKGRLWLFGHMAFARKVVLTNRPRWIEGSTGAPRHNYAWFIWDWTHKGPPIISYASKGK